MTISYQFQGLWEPGNGSPITFYRLKRHKAVIADKTTLGVTIIIEKQGLSKMFFDFPHPLRMTIALPIDEP